MCSERLTATRLAGFSPYVDHLYIFAGYIRVTTQIDRARPDGRHPYLVALLPATIYLASAAAKLRNGRESWLSTGEILDNALDLYGWNRTTHWVRLLDRATLSRAALSFELLALPVSIAGPRGLRAVSMLGLAFHATNFATMRISFWHLAFMHLPALYALVRKSDR